MAAAWFWSGRGLNALADDMTDDNDLEDFTEITKRINGGTVGIKDRLLALNQIDAKFA
jgi:putative chitinase